MTNLTLKASLLFVASLATHSFCTIASEDNPQQPPEAKHPVKLQGFYLGVTALYTPSWHEDKFAVRPVERSLAEQKSSTLNNFDDSEK